MSSIVINATAASLLGFLVPQSRTGWELMACIEDSIGEFWNVTRSQVYRELGTLAAAGLVRPGALGPRDRRPYEITEEGRAAFNDWINQEPGDGLIRIPLLLTVFFREHVLPERMERFLAVHRLRHAKHLEEYEALARDLEDMPGGPLDALDLGIAYERAVIGWLDQLQARAEGRPSAQAGASIEAAAAGGDEASRTL